MWQRHRSHRHQQQLERRLRWNHVAGHGGLDGGLRVDGGAKHDRDDRDDGHILHWSDVDRIRGGILDDLVIDCLVVHQHLVHQHVVQFAHVDREHQYQLVEPQHLGLDQQLRNHDLHELERLLDGRLQR